MAEPLLQLKKICKSFPGVKALDEVDFSIQEGEVVGLLGENGAGKEYACKNHLRCLYARLWRHDLEWKQI